MQDQRAKTAYRRVLRKVLPAATNDRQMAICLLFAADQVQEVGAKERAVNLLALAERHSAISTSWMGLHPLIVALQQ